MTEPFRAPEFDLDKMIMAGPWKASEYPDDGTPPWSIGKAEPMFWFDTHEDAERAVGLLNTLEREAGALPPVAPEPSEAARQIARQYEKAPCFAELLGEVDPRYCAYHPRGRSPKRGPMTEAPRSGGTPAAAPAQVPTLAPIARTAMSLADEYLAQDWPQKRAAVGAVRDFASWLTGVGISIVARPGGSVIVDVAAALHEQGDQT